MRKSVEEEAKMPKKSELGLMLRNKLSRRTAETKRQKEKKNQIRMKRIITNWVETNIVPGKAHILNQYDKIQNM